jgi:hypothetical protein
VHSNPIRPCRLRIIRRECGQNICISHVIICGQINWQGPSRALGGADRLIPVEFRVSWLESLAGRYAQSRHCSRSSEEHPAGYIKRIFYRRIFHLHLSFANVAAVFLAIALTFFLAIFLPADLVFRLRIAFIAIELRFLGIAFLSFCIFGLHKICLLDSEK